MDSRIASVIRLSEEDIKAIELQKSSIEKNELSKKNIIEKSSARINESGEILDKRDLLSGGLNLTYKSIEKKHSEIQAAIIREEKSKKEVVLKQIEQKERQRKYIEQQEKLMNARLASEKIVQEKELAEKIASKITNSSVLSAKERFLQRKKQQDKSANEEP
jgi:coiled-coil domain-containing protein 55